MSALVERTVRVWRAPTSSRGYRSRAAAYRRWAKDLLMARCDGGPDCECKTCDLFVVGYDAVDGDVIRDTKEYLRVKERLARWLAWRDRVAT